VNMGSLDFRHTCASLLLTAGVNPQIVSEQLGYASIILTLDRYSHVLTLRSKRVERRYRGTA
jgi:integrase